MQALSEDQLVCIDQPQLLEHIFLISCDRHTQAALLRTSKAWAAAGSRWPPVEVSVGLTGCEWWPVGRQQADSTQAEPLPGSGLAATAAWLAQQHCLVAQLSLRLEPSCYPGATRSGELGPSPSPEASELQDQAAAVLAAAAPRLCSLKLGSELDFWWLPRMSLLTHLCLDFGWDPADYDDARGPLDCIAAAAPHLRLLELSTSLAEEDEYDPPFLSAGPPLPPALSRLRVSGQVAGLGAQLSQLERLIWEPRGRSAWLRLPPDAVEGLRQASRLTWLVLSAPSPANVFAFFDSLACLTGLRSLCIQRPAQYGWMTLLSRHYYRDAEDYELVVHQVLPSALARLTSLTLLALIGHNLPACPATVARLPALKRLDISINTGLTELPYGRWPALEHMDVDPELIGAALASPPAHAQQQEPPVAEEGDIAGPEATAAAGSEAHGASTVAWPEPAAGAAAGAEAGSGHALWGLTRLTHLGWLWQLSLPKEEEEEEKRQAIRRLLPQLVHIR